MSLNADFAFTQGSLGDFAACARRFELRYIKRMRYPALEVDDPLQFEERTRQGARFHKLVQQHLLGVPAELLTASLADDEELARWWANYLAHGLIDLPEARHPEITLQAQLAGRRLVATYDLLALAPDGPAVIIDWKTGARVPSQSDLRGRMQTIVYRYVLAQAGAHLYAGESIPPERIRMDYVYVARGGERISFKYSTARMREDEALLSQMISAIAYADGFPLTDDLRRCRFCSYRSLCDRGEAGRLEDFDLDEVEDEAEEILTLDFDQIAEIEF
ncbi:MAG: PD-(D/E)XK nuclease family protein [Chloroflexota bacterium]|nr:PD-(D/E)XK nuclease family protein [Chloroflexota bacterium]MDE2908765.1 PD-(D/E)XK nuclease family protein [Chloroflexota bacterium]